MDTPFGCEAVLNEKKMMELLDLITRNVVIFSPFRPLIGVCVIRCYGPIHVFRRERSIRRRPRPGEYQALRVYRDVDINFLKMFHLFLRSLKPTLSPTVPRVSIFYLFDSVDSSSPVSQHHA